MPNGGFGAIVTLQHGRMDEWYLLMNMVKEYVREDALVIGSHPMNDGELVTAAAVVMTASSARYASQLALRHT